MERRIYCGMQDDQENTQTDSKKSDLDLDVMFKITYAELTKTKQRLETAHCVLNETVHKLRMASEQLRGLENRLNIADAKLSVLSLLDRCFGKQDFSADQCSPNESPGGLGWLNDTIKRAEEYFGSVKQQEYAEQHFKDAGLPKEVEAYAGGLTSSMTATEMSNHLDELEYCENKDEMWRIRVQAMREKCGLDKHPPQA